MPPSTTPPGTPPTGRRSAPTAHLLELVNAADRPQLLMAVGIAIHLFAEPARDRIALGTVDLHRATTFLTKQIVPILDEEDPLQRLRALATAPDRPALPDGTPVAELLGEHWEAVRAVADERSEASVDGARDFGETAVLRLAATRAAGAATPWWGTPAWRDAVARSGLDHQTATGLHDAPESAPIELLRQVLSTEDLPERRALPTPA